MFNQSLLKSALTARLSLLAEPHNTAVRLFNGFFEGWPELVVDLYAATLVLFLTTRKPPLT